MMKRCISLLLMLILVFNTAAVYAADVPAYAGTQAVLSAAESAVADSSSAASLQSWLDLYLRGTVYPVMSQYSNFVEAGNMTAGSDEIEALNTLASEENTQELIQTWAEAEYARFTLEDERYAIEQNLRVVKDTEATAVEQKKAYLRIYEGLQRIGEVTDEVAAQTADWSSAVAVQTKAAREVVVACPDFTDALNASLQSEAEAVQAGLHATDAETNEIIKVLVLNSRQTGIGVMDSSGAPIQGATVTFRDYVSGTTDGKTTGETGAATTLITQFTVNADTDCYRIDTTVTAPGKRTWRSLGRYIAGGEPVGNILMEDDDGTPYVEEVTFGGADVLNSSEVAYISPKNGVKHKLVVYLDPKGQSGTVQLTYVANNQEKTKIAPFNSSTRTLTFEEPWLQILTPESKFYVKIITGGKTASSGDDKGTPLSLTLKQGVVPEPVEKNIDVTGADTVFGGFSYKFKFSNKKWLSELGIDIQLPYVEMFGGQRIGLMPDGSYFAGINFPTSRTIGDKWKDGWKVNLNEYYSKCWDSMFKHSSQLKQMIDSGTMKVTKSDSKGKPVAGTVQGAKVTYGVVLDLHGKVTEKKNGASKSTYGFNTTSVAGVMANLNYNWTKYFMAWAIPVYGGIEVGLNGMFGIYFNSKYEGTSQMEFMNIAKLYNNKKFNGLAVQLAPYLKAYAGAGIRGLCGVSIQGLISYVFNLLYPVNKFKVMGNVKGSADLIGQFFFFTSKLNIFKYAQDPVTLWPKESKKKETVAEKDAEIAAENAAKDTAVVTGNVPSQALVTDTSVLQTYTDTSGLLASVSIGNATVVLYNDENGVPWVKMMDQNGQTVSQTEKKLADLEQTGLIRTDYKENLCFYEAKMVCIVENSRDIQGGIVVVSALAADKNSGFKTQKYTQPDGTEVEVLVPKETQLVTFVLCGYGYNLKSYFMASLSYLDCSYYGGVLTGLGMGIAQQPYATALIGGSLFITACTAKENSCGAFVQRQNYVIMPYSSMLIALLNKTTEYHLKLNKEDVAPGAKYAAQVEAVSLLWDAESDPKSMAYVRYVDQNDQYRILSWYIPTRFGKGVVTQLPGSGFEGMAVVNNMSNFKSATEFESSLFVAERQAGTEGYRLARYSTLLTADKIQETKRAESYDFMLTTPNISSMVAFGTSILCWQDVGAVMKTETEASAQHEINCIYIKTDKAHNYYVTKPFAMALFDAARISAESLSLKDLSILSGLKEYSGTVIGLDTSAESTKKNLFHFKLKQVLNCGINGATVLTPVIKSGGLTTVLFNVTNNGNVPLSGAKMRIVDTSNPTEYYEEIEIDFENSAQNSVRMHTGVYNCSLSGKVAVSEYDSVSATENDVIVTSADGKYTALRYNLLLPGETKTFRAVFPVPAAWGTGEKKLDCTFTEYRVRAEKDTTGLFTSAGTIVSCATRTSLDNGAVTEAVPANGDEYLTLVFDAQTAANGEERTPVLLSITDASGKALTVYEPTGENSEEAEIPEGQYDSAAPSSYAICLSDTDGEKSIISFAAPTVSVEADLYEENGTQMVRVYLSNLALTGADKLQLECYLDSSETPSAVISLTDSFMLGTQYGVMLTMPLTELTKGKKAQRLELHVTGTDSGDREVASNSYCDLYLTPKLVIVEHPQDLCLNRYGLTAEFSVTAEGTPVLSYQWQVSMDGGKTWHDLSGENDSVLSFGPLKRGSLLISSAEAAERIVLETSDKKCDNWLFRCRVEDGLNDRVTSKAAKLTYYIIPRTGDSFPAGWLLMTGACALALLVLLEKKRRRDASARSLRR